MLNTQAKEKQKNESERQKIENAVFIWEDGTGCQLYKHDSEFFFGFKPEAAGDCITEDVVYSDAILWLREKHPLVKVIEAGKDFYLVGVKDNKDFAFYDAAVAKMFTLSMTAKAVSDFLTESGKRKAGRRGFTRRTKHKKR